jgi:dolichyl-phosphate-mannose-protein mannosyltransferase
MPEQGETAPRGLPLSVGGVREGVVAGLIVAYALALRLLGVGRGLPYLHEWDEWFQVPPVIRMVLDHTLNPGIFIYGSFYYYLLLPVVYLHFVYLHALGLMKSMDDIVLMHPLVPGYGWYINVPSFYLWARAFTALFGAATVFVTYRLGRAAFGPAVGLLAAAVLAVAPGAVYYADTARVDVPMAFLSTAALLAGFGVLRRGRRRDYLAAGLLAGLAMSTKQTAVWVVPALLLAHLYNERRAGLVDRGLGFMIAGIVAGGLLGTPYLLIRPDLVRTGFGAQVGTYGIFSLPRLGDFFYLLALNLAYLVWPTQGGDWYVVPHAAIGLLPGLAAVAGLVVGFRRQRRVQAYLAVFPLLQLLFLARANVFYTRNLSPVLPLVSIWAALGAVWAWERAARLGPSWGDSQRLRRSAAAAAGVAILLIGPVWESAALGWWLYRHQDTRTQAVEWLVRHAPRGARVVFELDLAWYLPALDHLPFRVEWTDRTTPPSWYAKEHIDLAVVGDRNPVHTRPAAAVFPRPAYLPTFKKESKFIPNSYPIIDPAIFIVRPRAP